MPPTSEWSTAACSASTVKPPPEYVSSGAPALYAVSRPLSLTVRTSLKWLPPPGLTSSAGAESDSRALCTLIEFMFTGELILS